MKTELRSFDVWSTTNSWTYESYWTSDIIFLSVPESAKTHSLKILLEPSYDFDFVSTVKVCCHLLLIQVYNGSTLQARNLCWSHCACSPLNLDLVQWTYSKNSWKAYLCKSGIWVPIYCCCVFKSPVFWCHFNPTLMFFSVCCFYLVWNTHTTVKRYFIKKCNVIPWGYQ